jgi:hypothetical protein
MGNWVVRCSCDPEDSVTVQAETPTWPPDKLNALRLGRRLVAEVPAAPGRRAFVDITPILDRRDHLAGHEGWTRSDPRRSFRLGHWDYDERLIDGFDYDLGARHRPMAERSIAWLIGPKGRCRKLRHRGVTANDWLG